MKKLTIILSLLFLVASLSAQDTIFQYTYGGIQTEVCNQIRPTADGGYIMIGYTNSCGAGANDFYAVKVDSLGKAQWTHTYGGPLVDEGFSVAQTYDHGYAFVGYSDNNVANGYDVELVRTDSAGKLLWQKYYGGTDWDFGYGIAQTPDSGFIVCGQTYSYGAGSGDVYVIKTDKNGDTLWTKVIGGTGYDIGNAIYVNKDSLYAIAGSTTSFGKGDTDMYFLVLNSHGLILTDTTFGSTKPDVACDIEPYPQKKGYLISGYTDSINSGLPSVDFIYVDSNGHYFYQNINQWPGNHAFGKSAVVCDNSDIICAATCDVAGHGGYDVLSFHATNGGYYLGAELEGGTYDEQGNSCAEGLDHNVVFAGGTESTGLTSGDWDFYMFRFKYDTDMVQDGLLKHIVKQFLDTCKLTGMNELLANGPLVKVFPNPVVEDATVMVQGDISDKYWFNLYDITGKRVIDNMEMGMAGHGQFMLHFAKGKLSAGEYLYKVIDKNENIATGKIIIE